MTEQKQPILRLFKEMFLEYKPLWKHFLWILPLAGFTVAAQLVEPYVYKRIIDILTLSSGAPDISKIINLILIWVAVVIVSIVFEFLREYRFHRLMQREWSQVIARGIAGFLGKEYLYHLSVNNAEKIKVFNRWVDASYDAVKELVIQINKYSLLLVGYVTLAFFTNWQLTLSILVVTPLLLIIPIVVGNKAHHAQKAVSKLWDDMYGRIGDSIMNVLIVKLFSRIPFTQEIMKDRVVKAAAAQAKVGIYWSILEAGGQMINLILSLIVLSVSLYFFLQKSISLGEVVLFVTIASRVATPFFQLENSYRNLVRYAADYAKYRQVIEMPKEPDTGTLLFPKKYASIHFRNLTFRYPETKRDVLKNANIEIRRGEKIALVGHTGSGKSTIANLLARFYLPTSGSIRIDDTDIRDFSLESFRTRFAAVFQDTTLFNDTIEHNLAYVRDGISKKDIRKACEDANILDFIESLPEGFDTLVGERGLKLSGGEKQRIAIARAILADPEILILDEATSALDSKTEKLVSIALERLMAGRTSVIIAHRLSTIKRSDRIYLLESGKVLASGTHKELYTASSVYAEMVDYQRHGFVE